MSSPRPIICTLCKNDQRSYLFKELNDDEYAIISEQYDVDRSAYFCMLCIKRIQRKIERRKKQEAMFKKANGGSDEDEDSYDSLEEIKQRLQTQNGHR